jgi:ATP-dependent RNA helicase DDX52/ROK1
MDVVKILSTSIKKIRKPTIEAGQTSKLPSAGIAPNPQFFHDSAPEPRGKKRKFTGVETQEFSSLEFGEELNYFAARENNLDVRSTVKKVGTSTVREDLNIGKASQFLDETGCRQVLQSHRLKVTLLPSTSSPTSVEKIKKLKGNNKSTAVNNKNKFQQLYPQPLQSFEDLQILYGTSKRLCENLAQQGYEIPTDVQLGTLPLLLHPDIALKTNPNSGEPLEDRKDVDLLVIAPTGSGKTLAFLVPIIQRTVQRRRQTKSQESHRLEAIVVVPTKELAGQIVNEGRKLTIGTGVKVIGMQKGMKFPRGDAEFGEYDSDEDETDDSRGDGENPEGLKEKTLGNSRQPVTKADILVTTPLALLNTLTTETRVLPLPAVRHLVIDEADVLLDPLFRDQTLGIWGACINPDLHVTLWSATIGSNIEALASYTIRSRGSSLNLSNSNPLIRVVVGLKDSAIPNISHRLIYTATESGKLLALRQLLHPTSSDSKPLRPPFIIFTQTIPRAVALHSELLYDIPSEAGGASRLAILHSDLSSTARSTVMSRFRAGEIWILITTDIFSRGVDFRGINGVVNYDIPSSSAIYVHRVGRTGRAGREGGVAVTFYTKEDVPYVKNVANVISASERQAATLEGLNGQKEPETGGGLPQWLLDSLPKPSKAEKKKLKLRGVEARRVGVAGSKRRKEMKISTKSGFDRRRENNRKGAIQGNRRRTHEVKDERDHEGSGVEGSEWSGIDE